MQLSGACVCCQPKFVTYNICAYAPLTTIAAERVLDGGKISVFDHPDAYLFENAVTRVKLGHYDGDTLVAIKSTWLPENKDARTKAFREKNALKKLHHPNIVRCVLCVQVWGLYHCIALFIIMLCLDLCLVWWFC